MCNLTALVQPAPAAAEPGKPARQHTQEAVLPPAAGGDIGWGAAVCDLGTARVGLLLCYPFKPGTLLAVSLHATGGTRTLLARVLHATDRADGSWLVGCEFTRRLSEQELATLR